MSILTTFTPTVITAMVSSNNVMPPIPTQPTLLAVADSEEPIQTVPVFLVEAHFAPQLKLACTPAVILNFVSTKTLFPKFVLLADLEPNTVTQLLALQTLSFVLAISEEPLVTALDNLAEADSVSSVKRVSKTTEIMITTFLAALIKSMPKTATKPVTKTEDTSLSVPQFSDQTVSTPVANVFIPE